MLSWHKEPCISCEHNPYRKAYEYDGEKEKWIKKDNNLQSMATRRRAFRKHDQQLCVCGEGLFYKIQ